ncbi:MAG TPA: hypothetical protein VEX60_07650 [Pyrinomonadaceae bacterium]|nr:hypothetical protein [Pyrinomonadaceae bacterium]
MSDNGTFAVGLLDMAGNPAVDPSVEVSFNRFGQAEPFLRKAGLSFPPRRAFTIPFVAFKQVNCWVVPSRFRMRQSGYFNILADENVTKDLNVFRIPEKWEARFFPWSQLPESFASLRTVLGASHNVKVKNKDALTTIGDFSGQSYDDASSQPAVLAKASLLNLYFKLMKLKEPVGNKDTWFSFVQEMLVIGRERFVAVADPGVEQIINKIKDNIGDYKKDYKNALADLHYKNFPAEYNVLKSKMRSIKSTEDNGNIQLTVAPGTHPTTGQPVTLLDADIDEDNKLIAHILSLFKHKFNGGTHPHNIYDYLLYQYGKNIMLGYNLI